MKADRSLYPPKCLSISLLMSFQILGCLEITSSVASPRIFPMRRTTITRWLLLHIVCTVVEEPINVLKAIGLPSYSGTILKITERFDSLSCLWHVGLINKLTFGKSNKNKYCVSKITRFLVKMVLFLN